MIHIDLEDPDDNDEPLNHLLRKEDVDNLPSTPAVSNGSRGATSENIIDGVNEQKRVKSRHYSLEGDTVERTLSSDKVSGAYVFKVDRETGQEYKQGGDGKREYLTPPNEEINWDALAYSLAVKYDNKVDRLLAMPDKQWKATPNTKGLRRWVPWNWPALLRKNREIESYKADMRLDKLGFAKIDELLDLALSAPRPRSLMSIWREIVLFRILRRDYY